MKFKVGIKGLKLKTSKGVNTSDYYSDALLHFLIPKLKNKKQLKEVFEMGTGRGYIALVLAKKFPSIQSVIASDITDEALKLAHKNVVTNKLFKIIKVKKGSLYKPVGRKKFDLIIAVPPQLPITLSELKPFLPLVSSYHTTTSVGGKNGRDIIDKMIKLAYDYLNPKGVLCFVHADFVDTQASLNGLKKQNLQPKVIGKYKKNLAETSLTKLIKTNIESRGYRFKKDKQGNEYFEVVVIMGVREK